MKTFKALVAIGAMAISTLGLAARVSEPEQKVESPGAAKIRSALHERYPQVKISQINAGPVPGLFELVTDAGLAYTDSNADYLFIGKILDTKTQEDITEGRWNSLNAIPFDKLPLDLAIKFVKGNGKRRLAVFEDPHCPFCRQLEGEMQHLNDVTIYIFLYPIESLHPGATSTAQNIWCAKDRAAAWSNAMLNKESPPAAQCKTEGLKKILALADQLNINATPTLFFADGRRHAGSMTADQLNKDLDVSATN